MEEAHAAEIEEIEDIKEAHYIELDEVKRECSNKMEKAERDHAAELDGVKKSYIVELTKSRRSTLLNLEKLAMKLWNSKGSTKTLNMKAVYGQDKTLGFIPTPPISLSGWTTMIEI